MSALPHMPLSERIITTRSPKDAKRARRFNHAAFTKRKVGFAMPYKAVWLPAEAEEIQTALDAFIDSLPDLEPVDLELLDVKYVSCAEGLYIAVINPRQRTADHHFLCDMSSGYNSKRRSYCKTIEAWLAESRIPTYYWGGYGD
jgi:hypothetical protein